MNRPLLVGCVVLGFAASACAADQGSIRGKVEKPEGVTAVFALHRAEKAEKYAGKIDPKTGEFAIPDLPLGKSYDLVIDFGGARLEGVSLKVPKTDFIDGDPPLTKADEEKLKALMKRLNQFEDVQDVLAIGGNVQHAAVLINKVRTQPFVNSNPGEAIWRCELWRFEREEPEDNWVKEQDTLFVVLYRERLQKADYDKKAITFDPKLGGLEPTDKQPAVELGRVTLPTNKPGVRIRNAPVNPEKKEE